MREDKLAFWLSRLEATELPILSRSVSLLRSARQLDGAHGARITEAIMADANLTARVLKLANSVVYSRQRGISSVSRALLCLGYRNVQMLVASAMLIESVEGTCRQAMQRLLQRGVVRAQLAQHMLETYTLSVELDSEDIYIGALLYELGAMLVLAHQCNKKKPVSIEEIDTLLGFSPALLTKTLAKTWHLGEGLQMATSNTDNAVSILTKKVDAVARAVEEGRTLEEIARDHKFWVDDHSIKLDERKALLERALAAANTNLESLGLPITVCSSDKLPEVDLDNDRPDKSKLKPKMDMVMSVLSDMIALGRQAELDFNLLLQALVEGIHRGANVPNVALIFKTPGKDALEVRLALGSQKEKLREILGVSTNEVIRDPLFSMLFNDGMPLHFGHATRTSPDVKYCSVPAFLQSICKCGLALPIVLRGRTIAAAVCVSEQLLDVDILNACLTLSEQANLCLRAAGQIH